MNVKGLILCSLLFAPVPCRAQEGREPAEEVAPGEVVRVDTDLVPVEVTVRDASGQVVRGLRINLRWRHAEIGTESLVETSPDGTTWTLAWQGWTGALALSAAIEDQRLVPLTIPLPDVRARFVRVSTVPLWVGRELTVHGPR